MIHKILLTLFMGFIVNCVLGIATVGDDKMQNILTKTATVQGIGIVSVILYLIWEM